MVSKKTITKYSRIQHYCKICNVKISRGSERCRSCGNKGRTAWNKGKNSPKTAGKNSVHWKGGKRINSSGYLEIYIPEHPFANKLKLIAEHRLIVEKKIGRYLKPEEIVHHIDENKLNNKIENLMLFKSNQKHTKFHTKIKQFGMTNPIINQIKNRWNEL